MFAEVGNAMLHRAEDVLHANDTNHTVSSGSPKFRAFFFYGAHNIRSSHILKVGAWGMLSPDGGIPPNDVAASGDVDRAPDLDGDILLIPNGLDGTRSGSQFALPIN
jgi:hypothetical protein